MELRNFTREDICGVLSNTSYFEVSDADFNATSSPCIPFTLYVPTMLLVTEYVIAIAAGICAAFLFALNVALLPRLLGELKKSKHSDEKALDRLYIYCCVFGLPGTIVQLVVALRGFYFTTRFDTIGGASNVVGWLLGQGLVMTAIVSFAFIFQQLTILSLDVPLVNLPNSDKGVAATAGYSVFAVVMPILALATGLVTDPFSYLRFWIPIGLFPVVVFGYVVPRMIKPVIDSINAVLTTSSADDSSTKTSKKFSLRNSLRFSSKRASSKVSTESTAQTAQMSNDIRLRKARRSVILAEKACKYASYGSFALNVAIYFSPLFTMPNFILCFKIYYVVAQLQIVAVMIQTMFRKLRSLQAMQLNSKYTTSNKGSKGNSALEKEATKGGVSR